MNIYLSRKIHNFEFFFLHKYKNLTHEAPSNLCFPLQSFLVYCEISDPMLWLPLQTKHSDVHHP